MEKTLHKIPVKIKPGLYRTPEGKQYPSVTTLLQAVAKPALVNWAANTERELVIQSAADLWEDIPLNGKTPKMNRTAYITTLQNRIGKTKAHQKELTKAMEIGSQVHALIEWNLRKTLKQKVGAEPRINDKALWAFMVWEEWAKANSFSPILCEQIVWSESYGYAGTMDLLARIDYGGEALSVVVDWKTGKAIYDEALLQNSAYVHALIEMGHAKPPLHGLIVRLPKVETDTKPEMKIIRWENQEKLFETFLHVKHLWEWQHGNGRK